MSEEVSAEELARRIKEQAKQRIRQRKRGSADAPAVKEPVLIRGDRVKARHFEPLWDGVVWRREYTLFYGMPTIGKSTIGNHIVSCVTTGDPFPGQPESSRRPPMSVIYLSAEDDLETVVKPQLVAAGADMRNVHFLLAGKVGEEMSSVDLSTDLKTVEKTFKLETLETTDADDVGLIVISPVTSYMGEKGDQSSATGVRNILDKFILILRRYNVACILIGHPPKNVGDTVAMYQFSGSIQWAAAARAMMYCMEDPADDASERRLFLRSKLNIGKDAPFGHAYRMVGATAVIDGEDFPTSKVEWLGRDDKNPNEVIKEIRERQAPGGGEQDKFADAMLAIVAALLGGKRSGAHLQRVKADERIADKTFARARARLRDKGIIVSEGGGRNIVWKLRLGDQIDLPLSEGENDEEQPF